MQLLGHKNIRNTLVYIHLINLGPDDYVCRDHYNEWEASPRGKVDFDFMVDVKDVLWFEKRK
jgi:hypothetical protein